MSYLRQDIKDSSRQWTIYSREVLTQAQPRGHETDADGPRVSSRRAHKASTTFATYVRILFDFNANSILILYPSLEFFEAEPLQFSMSVLQNIRSLLCPGFDCPGASREFREQMILKTN